jgi:hypothetical protein
VKVKARENLDSALLLLRAGRLNACASRLYYALFQAAIHALERQGMRPAEFRSARRWGHETILEAAPLARGEPADRLLLENARRLRLQANYAREAVSRRDIEQLRHEACRFVLEATE